MALKRNKYQRLNPQSSRSNKKWVKQNVWLLLTRRPKKKDTAVIRNPFKKSCMNTTTALHVVQHVRWGLSACVCVCVCQLECVCHRLCSNGAWQTRPKRTLVSAEGNMWLRSSRSAATLSRALCGWWEAAWSLCSKWTFGWGLQSTPSMSPRWAVLGCNAKNTPGVAGKRSVSDICGNSTLN